MLFLSPEGPTEFSVHDPELTLQISDVRSEANTTKETIPESELQLSGLADIDPNRDDETIIYDLPEIGDVADDEDEPDNDPEIQVEDDDQFVHDVQEGILGESPDKESPTDKRSEKLGGHFQALMTFMTRVAEVAENDYVILQKGGKPSESNEKFAYDLLEAGNEIMKGGQCLVDKSYKYLEAHERAMAKWRLDVEKGLIKEEVDDEVQVFEESGAAGGSSGIGQKGKQMTVKLPQVDKAVKKSVGKKGMKICHICQASFREQRQLEDHNRLHTGEELSCDICHQTFTSEQRYKEHMRDHNQGPYTCPHCGAVLTKKGSFLNHVKQVHETDPMICNNTKCSRTFTNKQHYTDHIDHAHLPTKTCACDLCGKLCQTFAAVRTHKSVSCPERAAYREQKRQAKASKEPSSTSTKGEGNVSRLKRMWQKDTE